MCKFQTLKTFVKDVNKYNANLSIEWIGKNQENENAMSIQNLDKAFVITKTKTGYFVEIFEDGYCSHYDNGNTQHEIAKFIMKNLD